MNRRQFSRCLLAATLVSLAGPAAGASMPTVAIVLKSMRNEFFVSMADGARAHHQAHQSDYRLVVEGVQEETDVKGQEAIIKRLMANHIQALIIVPADSAALLPTLLHAMAGGMLVINMDNKLDDRALAASGVNVPFVGPSNFSGARSVGEYVARALPPRSKVGLIEGPTGSINAKARSDGFREAMRAAGMDVVGMRSGDWDTGRGKVAAAELLKGFPAIRALLCGNDNMAIGAQQAVQAAGVSKRVLIAGYDHIPSIGPLIASGKVYATADQYPARQAGYAIDLALKALKEGTRQADLPTIVQTPVQLITK